MSRWLRTLITFIRAQFLKNINPDEEISLNFRVWITDVDLSIMNNAAMLTITEMGRIDLIIRTGFLKHAWKNRLYFPLGRNFIIYGDPIVLTLERLPMKL